MRIGVLGGTFDPVHLGHLIIAEEARVQLGLERVVFVPAGQPWLKEGQPLTPARHRLEMVRRAVATNPYFQVSRVEVDRSGPTYTVDTLLELRREVDEGVDLYFIVGLDALAQFHRWKEPERLLELCHLAVARRPGCGTFDWPAWFARYPAAASTVMLLQAPLIDISGTEIRRRAAAGISYCYQVPDSVAEYIQAHRLYQPNGGKVAPP